jgi:hypothetical protein
MEEREPPGAEKRRHPRFPLSCPIAFSGDHLQQGEGTVVNISKLGCAVQSHNQVEEGAYLNLALRFPREARQWDLPMKVELAVVRFSGLPGAEGRLFGMEFIRVHPKEQERLHEQIRLLEIRPSK